MKVLRTMYNVLLQRLAVASLLFFFSFSSVLAAEVTLNVQVSRQAIYFGESFNINIILDGADQGVSAPDLSSLSKAEIQFLGSHSNSRSSFSVINGRVKREIYQGRIFAYQIKPLEKGRFLSGPIRVKVGAKTYQNEGVFVEVTGIERQDAVLAKVSASSTAILVEEPFTVTLTVAVADLPEPFAKENEPLFGNLPPNLSVDFLELNRQQEPGLKGPDLNQLLNGLIDQTGRQPCFTLNNYMSRDAMNLGAFLGGDPFQPRPIRFRLPAARKQINGKSYREYTLTLNYVASKEGEFTFGPLTFKGKIITGVNEAHQAIPQEIYTIGPAVTVRVTPPPDEGRPECFIGAVGRNVEARAALDASTCKVGDPLTLTLEVTGRVSISNMRTPVLGLQSALTRDFRIYDENVKAETLANGKRFTYQVRPLREGTLEFPPIKIGYYNSERRAYEILTTQPLPLQAKPTTQIATTSGPLTDEKGLQEAQEILPCGMTVVPLAKKNDMLWPSGQTMLLLFVTGPLACLLVLVSNPFRRLLVNLRTYNRTSGALRRSRVACHKAKTPAAFIQAVRCYLAERLGLVSGMALTPSDAAVALISHGVSEGLAQELQTLLIQLEESLYRPDASEPLAQSAKVLAETLKKIDKEVEKCG
jgi:hypothetical protein